MGEQIGEVSVAYFTRTYLNKLHIAMVDGEDAGKLIAAGWQQITRAEFDELRQQLREMDLRSRPQ